MPKQVMSAAEILEQAAPASEAQVTVVPTPDPAAAPAEKPEQQAGFETPTEVVEEVAVETPAAPAVSAAEVLAQSAPVAQVPASLASEDASRAGPSAEEIARLEYEEGVKLAQAGEPLPEDAPDSAKIGYASVTPPNESAEVEKQWRFVKNVHPFEIIAFRGGETYKFPGNCLVTSDAELAAKLLEVADLYHVCLQ